MHNNKDTNGGSSSSSGHPILHSIQTGSSSPSQIIPSVQHIQQSINLQPIKIPSPIDENSGSSKVVLSPNDRMSLSSASSFGKSYHYSSTTPIISHQPQSASSTSSSRPAVLIASSPTIQPTTAPPQPPPSATSLPPINSRSPPTRILAPMQVPPPQPQPQPQQQQQQQQPPPVQTPPQPIPSYSTNQYVYFQQQPNQQQQQPQYPPAQYVYYQQQAQAQAQQQFMLQQSNPYYQQVRYQHQQLQQVQQGLAPTIGGAANIRRKSKQSTTWSPKEDKLLRELKEVQKLGWREISTFFNDRTPNACQFRWRRIISSVTGNTSTVNITRNNLPSVGGLGGADAGKSPAKGNGHSINFLLN
ncbi:hypothetical protein Cantr_01732 [Candida viswanathii]|uniref:Uncharacterized protein n=1 Tax=Candida viswanathii TaxID=5486 RepID=A0A367YKF3_9ASCO|nr:hypothetical protein Cantr_01732 [Candida viswanathii]